MGRREQPFRLGFQRALGGSVYNPGWIEAKGDYPLMRRTGHVDLWIGVVAGWISGCGGTPPAPAPESSVELAPAASAPPATSASPHAAATGDGAPCGELGCRLFDSPESAFRAVLADQPRVLAIGEAHAQKGMEGVESTTKRFTTSLLPLLKGQATDLVVELWVADKKCAAPKVAAVAKKQEPVTTGQAGGNQNEFVALGEASKGLGIVPHILRPSCEEYDAILAAGDDAVLRMLEMITRLTSEKVQKLLESQKEVPVPVVVAYGGAMHNDLSPKEGREAWSFGPELNDKTGGRYVELDLIVPEFIKDNDTWKALPWYGHYDAGKHPGKTILFEPKERSYVLIFPRKAP